MFQAVGDLLTLRWVREPLQSWLAWPISNDAELSAESKANEATRGADEGTVEAPTTSRRDQRAISWGDRDGGDLERFLDAEEKSDGHTQQTTENPAESSLHLLRETDFEQSSSSLGTDEGDEAEGVKLSKLTVEPRRPPLPLFESTNNSSDDSASPEWGWFVTMTPPQSAFADSESNATKS